MIFTLIALVIFVANLWFAITQRSLLNLGCALYMLVAWYVEVRELIFFIDRTLRLW